MTTQIPLKKAESYKELNWQNYEKDVEECTINKSSCGHGDFFKKSAPSCGMRKKY